MAQGRKTGGRKKGTLNKLTTALRERELAAFADVVGRGDQEQAFTALYEWGWKALKDKKLSADVKTRIWQTLIERAGGKLPQPLKAGGDEQDPVILNVLLHKDAPPA